MEADARNVADRLVKGETVEWVRRRVFHTHLYVVEQPTFTLDMPNSFPDLRAALEEHLVA